MSAIGRKRTYAGIREVLFAFFFILVEFVAEGADADTEDVGGFGFVVAGFFQRFENEFPLHLVNRAAEIAQGVALAATGGCRLALFHEQVGRLDGVSLADQYGAFDNIC